MPEGFYGDLTLLYDVPMVIEAEMGRSNKSVRDVLRIGEGSVIDFDKVMRDPAHPDRLAPALDSGDHLHPSEAGYRKMGEAVPLGLFS